MRRKLIYIISMSMSWALFYACIDDKSSYFQTEGSPITITTSDSVYDVEFGIPLVIAPEFSQTIPDLELKYEWRSIAMDGKSGSDSLIFIGTDEKLIYSFPRFGSFRVRLRVENKYGSTFKFFDVNVLAPYDAGILIASRDENDKARLSFVRAKNNEDLFQKTEDDFYIDAFDRINPDIKLNGIRDADVSGVTGSNGMYQLLLSSETEGKFYCLNSQTFLVENIVNVTANLPGMRPTQFCTRTDSYGSFANVYFISKDDEGRPGDMALLDMQEQYVLPDKQYLPEDGAYEKMISGIASYETSGKGAWSLSCLVNRKEKVLHIADQYRGFDGSEHLEGQEFINACFYNNAGNKDGCQLIFVTTRNDSVLVYQSQNYRNCALDSKLYLEGNKPYAYQPVNAITLSYESQVVACDKYKALFYNRGNKIYRWAPYSTTSPILPENPVIPIPGDEDKLVAGDEITCMQVSPDEDYLYVCVYNPNATTELKGKLLIVNTDNLKVEKVFTGISDRAFKVMWKNSL